eukprot:COSAG01_NODE_198_length_22280_cov_21.529775_8_plen_68_part_00
MGPDCAAMLLPLLAAMLAAGCCCGRLSCYCCCAATATLLRWGCDAASRAEVLQGAAAAGDTTSKTTP